MLWGKFTAKVMGTGHKSPRGGEQGGKRKKRPPLDWGQSGVGKRNTSEKCDTHHTKKYAGEEKATRGLGRRSERKKKKLASSIRHHAGRRKRTLKKRGENRQDGEVQDERADMGRKR